MMSKEDEEALIRGQHAELVIKELCRRLKCRPPHLIMRVRELVAENETLKKKLNELTR